MRLRMNDSRERRLEDLQEALDEKTKSKALDKAAEFTIRMRGDTTAIPTGNISQLMQLAVEEGSVTPEQIAETLTTPQIPVDYESSWSVESGE